MARVLLIEDEAVVRILICRMLAAAGHDVLDIAEASDARELLSLFGAEVVIADLLLGGHDSIAALRAIRESLATLPLIVISGRDREEVSDRLHENGLHCGVWLLAKPFAQEELLATVRAALALEV